MEKEEDIENPNVAKELKVYKESAYLNSNKDPFGLTIKGKSKGYIEAQKRSRD